MNLNASTIGDLRDGLAGALIDKEINAALKDCEDAPSIEKARTVTITLKITPEMNNTTRELDAVAISVAATHSNPKRETNPAYLAAEIDEDRNVAVLFPNIHQTPLYEGAKND